MDNQEYIPYQKIAGHLGIEHGTVLWLSADLTRLVFMAKRKEGAFDAMKFLESFMEQVGNEGTLAIPAFNFNLRDKDRYSRKRTLPITGALATEAMKSGKFLRTKNPLHSFLVWGKESRTLCNLGNKSSFGADSPFAFFHDYHGKMVIIGTSVSNAFTFVHYLEELHKVNYRKYRKINIFHEDDLCWEEFLLYAKKPGWTMEMTGLQDLLISSGIAEQTIINGIPSFKVDLAASFPVIREDITMNHARNLARFSTKLYLRDAVKANLERIGITTTSDKISHDPGLL